jgi:hypothetical protein
MVTMKYLTLLLAIFVLSGCFQAMADREEAKARQAEAAQLAQQIVIEATATAQQQQIDAQTAALQAQAQAAAAQAESAADIAAVNAQTDQLEVLAKAAKPTYWPIVAVVLVFAGLLLLFMRWHMVTVSHVAVGRPVADLPMLPDGVTSFAQMRREAARIGCTIEARGDSFYLVDSQGREKKVKALLNG